MNIELEFDYDAHFGVPDCVIAIDGHTVYSAPITDRISVSTQIPDGVHELRITHLNKKKQHTSHTISTLKITRNTMRITNEYCNYCQYGNNIMKNIKTVKKN